MPSWARVRRTGSGDCSTSRMISSFSAAGYLMRRPPQPRACDAEFVAAGRSDVTARRLSTIPGIGTLNATALVAAVGNARSFARARDLAAWLGLVRRQATTGGRPRLLGITKRGNKYLRTLLIHGARAALPALSTTEGSLGNWLRGLSARAHRNTVVVALASKLARIAWSVLRSGTTYNATMGDQTAMA
jgi:transposase